MSHHKPSFMTKFTSYFKTSKQPKPSKHNRMPTVSANASTPSTESIGTSQIDLLDASQANGSQNKQSNTASKISLSKNIVSSKMSSIYAKVSQITDSMNDVFSEPSSSKPSLGIVTNNKNDKNKSKNNNNSTINININKQHKHGTNNKLGLPHRGGNMFSHSVTSTATPSATGSNTGNELSRNDGNVRLIGFGFDETITCSNAFNKRDLSDIKRIKSYIFGGINRILLLKQFFAFLKYNKIKIVIISNNKHKNIIKCLQIAELTKYIENIYDKTSIIDHNGYKSNVMEYLINVKYQIQGTFLNFDELNNENENENELHIEIKNNEINEIDEINEPKEVIIDENKSNSIDECKALFVDSKKEVIDSFHENPICYSIHIHSNKANESGMQLQDMIIIAKKMGLNFDTREKWYM